ncbi:MAG: hypothetical protein ACTHMT_07975 [Verrucomicrobiota bacterium]
MKMPPLRSGGVEGMRNARNGLGAWLELDGTDNGIRENFWWNVRNCAVF